MYYSAVVWEKPIRLPATCKKAQPFDYEHVSNCDVVYVTNASYRNATLSGYFLPSPFEIPQRYGVLGKIVVLCRWFDHRLLGTGLTLKVNSANVQHVQNYTGYVISDIRRV
jgi:hypothetical protein